jgi:hypothetical protein
VCLAHYVCCALEEEVSNRGTTPTFPTGDSSFETATFFMADLLFWRKTVCGTDVVTAYQIHNSIMSSGYDIPTAVVRSLTAFLNVPPGRFLFYDFAFMYETIWFIILINMYYSQLKRIFVNTDMAIHLPHIETYHSIFGFFIVQNYRQVSFIFPLKLKYLLTQTSYKTKTTLLY